MEVITRNAVRCLKCLDEIESKHHHDFVWCRCGNIAVDGGTQWQRRIGAALADGSWDDLSVVDGVQVDPRAAPERTAKVLRERNDAE